MFYIRKMLQQDIDMDFVVVHVGFNYIMKGNSEQLKLDFKELNDCLLDSNNHIWPCALSESWH